MAHPRVQLGVADQDLGHLGVVAALGVALQRVGVVLVQLVVQSAPVEQRAAFLLAVFPGHLPEEERAELGPEAEALAAGRTGRAVKAEHGGIALEPVQQRSRPRVAADHAGQLQIKALKGRQLQKEPPDGQVEAQVHRRLKVQKHLVERLRQHLRPEGPSPGHAPRRDRHAQRIPGGLLQNAAQLTLRRLHTAAVQQAQHVLPVKGQRVRVQHGHQARVLKRPQARRRRAPGEQEEPPVRPVPDQGAQSLPLGVLLQKLEIVQQQELPVPLRGREGEIQLSRREPQRGPPRQQCVRQNGLSKPAGRTEKQHAAPLHHLFKLLGRGRPDNDLLRHGSPFVSPLIFQTRPHAGR